MSLVRDLVHAARTLVKARAFTAVCVTSLGLGMGVVIAILLFTRMFLEAPPHVNDTGLVELVIRPHGPLRAQVGDDIMDAWSYADYLDVRDASTGFVTTGWSPGDGLFREANQGPVIPLATMYVSSNYFSTLGMALPQGPGFTPMDDASRAEAEAVISHRLWQLRFGSDPHIVGRAISVNQSEYVIVGVTPEGFRGHLSDLNDASYQLWLPLSRHPLLLTTETARLDRSASWVHVMARLMPGTTLAHADTAVQSVMATLATRYAASHQDRAGGAEPYLPIGARMQSEVAFVTSVLVGLAAMVLLIVGLNISGMMLVRSAMREKELAIRLAMGASRWHLMQYHLTEALVMAVWGGSLASVLLFGGPVVLAHAFDLFGPALDLFRPDAWLVLQCIALCFATSLILGLLPAIRFSRPSIVTTLKNDSAGSGRRVGHLQRLTAAAQAGIAVPFLVICGVQLDQARVTALADVGFAPQGLYAARLNLSAVTRTADERRLFTQIVTERLAAAPGVTSSSAADGVPLDFLYRNTRVARDGDTRFVQAHTTRVEAGYLETIGARLLAGRTIDANDREGAERVVVVSEPLARQLFPTGDPLGERVVFALPGAERQTYTVVGVSADLVSTQMSTPRPQLFVSLAQSPVSTVLAVARGRVGDSSMRAAFENAAAEALRQTSGSSDPAFVVQEFFTGERLIDNSRSDFLTSSAVGGLAAGVALMLAALGVYGVIAFMVAIRTREIGVRVALGATRARVVGEVLGDALTLVVPGIAMGLLLAVLWVRLGDVSWYPLGGVEPLAYGLAAATVFATAVLAGIPSARRAAAVHPMTAIRSE